MAEQSNSTFDDLVHPQPSANVLAEILNSFRILNSMSAKLDRLHADLLLVQRRQDQIMSAISDFAAKVEEDLGTIKNKVSAIQVALAAAIAGAGSLSAEDKATLDKVMTDVDDLAGAIQVPTAPTAPEPTAPQVQAMKSMGLKDQHIADLTKAVAAHGLFSNFDWQKFIQEILPILLSSLGK